MSKRIFQGISNSYILLLSPAQVGESVSATTRFDHGTESLVGEVVERLETPAGVLLLLKQLPANEVCIGWSLIPLWLPKYGGQAGVLCTWKDDADLDAIFEQHSKRSVCDSLCATHYRRPWEKIPAPMFSNVPTSMGESCNPID